MGTRTVQTQPEVEPLSLELFGGLEIRIGGRLLPRLRSRSERWLLALLILRRARETDRTWLAETLWPQSAPGQGLFYVRRSLSDLRRALGAHAHRLEAPGPRSVYLNLDGAECDLLRFDAAVARADAASLEEAVSLYRGPLLTGCQEDWIFPEREVRHQAYLGALERLSGEASSRGYAGAAIRYLRAALAVDPFRESLHRRLMELLVEQGDWAAALQVYRDLRLLLHRELNAAPAPETTSLWDRLLHQAQQSASAPINLSSPTPPSRPPFRVPCPVSTLVGRGQEIGAVRACLAESRLVTLTGMGGIGKTRLAVEVAHAVSESYPGGVWLVDLASLTDGIQLAEKVASTLGVRPEHGVDVFDTVQAFLQARRSLLLLDNCEHLVEPCARLAAALLAQCAELQILATSRETLGITGEVVWRVPPLSTPQTPPVGAPAAHQLTEMLGWEAISLFLERARQARPGFDPTPSELQAVGEICRSLDGVPLAIELAAARVKVLSPLEIAAKLEDRFALLTDGCRAALPRQQTLEATLDWSHRLLSEGEKRVLRRLSVLAGEFSLTAVEALCPEPSSSELPEDTAAAEGASTRDTGTLTLFARLVDRSMVTLAPNREAEGPTRYRLLETVRQYAYQRLTEAGEVEWARERHFRFFLERIETLPGGPECPLWHQLLERDYENVRAALEWAVSRGADGAGRAGRLAALVHPFWATRQFYREGREWWERILASAGPTDGGRARAFDGAGEMALVQGDYDAGRRYLEAGAQLAVQAGDVRQHAWILLHLGQLLHRQTDPAARAPYAQALSLARAVGDRVCGAWCLLDWGRLTAELGNQPLAHARGEKALALFRALEHGPGIAAALRFMAAQRVEAGERAEGRRMFEQSLALSREFGDPVGTAWTLADLGVLEYLDGNHQRSSELLEESLAQRRALGDRIGIAHTLLELATVALQRNDPTTARTLLEESLALRAHEPQAASRRLLRLGDLERRDGNMERAESLYHVALTNGRDVDDPDLILGALQGLAMVSLSRGDREGAHSLLTESLELVRARDHRRKVARSLEGIARVATAGGRYPEAVRLLSAASTVWAAFREPHPPAECSERDAAVASLRSALSEEAFAAAWTEGQAMTLEKAVAEARSLPPG